MFDIKDITPSVTYNTGCDYHRVIMPLTHMGMDFKQYENLPEPDMLKVIKRTKILIFNRRPQAGLDIFLSLRRKYKFKIICDIDDYWNLPSNHYLYNTYKKNEESKKIEESLKAADAVFCTTSILADKILEFNKSVHVIPNALPFGEDQFTSKKTESESFRVIYAGGTSHFWDIKQLHFALQKLKSNTNIQFILAGHDGNKGATWDKIERAFTLNYKLPNYKRRYSLGLSKYMEHYEDADLSLAPLELNYFNQFKSNLKTLEAGCKNIPIITSNMLPYANKADLPYIRTASNTREWIDIINYFSKNPNYASERGHFLGEYVRKRYDLQSINEQRKQIFEYLINK